MYTSPELDYCKNCEAFERQKFNIENGIDQKILCPYAAQQIVFALVKTGGVDLANGFSYIDELGSESENCAVDQQTKSISPGLLTEVLKIPRDDVLQRLDLLL